jgi:transposase-like protein
MARKNQKNPVLEAIRRASKDEAAAVAFIEGLRWGQEPACPHCAAANVYAMRDRKTGEREKNYRWRCRACGKMFSVRTSTVFEETRLPLRHWCHAFWRACASKKGVSALQIARECEITHKSALFLMHRIRLAMETGPDAPKLSGIVEADETYVGGKPRYRAGINPKTGKRYTGRGTRKTPVFAVVQRGGDVRLSKLDRITAPRLIPAIWEVVDQANTTVMTDELGAYHGVGRRVSGGHFTVKHSAGQYVDGRNGEVHSNTVESVFSLIKRGLIGTFHSVSKHHRRFRLSCG